ncbi:MAG: 3-deoxy-D-manno-octulosonic acid transferase [Flavobacteriaceae bacterium]|nr:3-deoxy-D-manno-octulosonic acid transferase [Flavobacteriaceae bacterium]
MIFFYNIAVYITGFVLNIVSLFNKKIALFVNGRKETFAKLTTEFEGKSKVIWFHCASLGEFEQGRPIIEKCKREIKDSKVLVTFFSPSGYEVRKNYAEADAVVYLPLDTKSNAKRFLDIVKPSVAVFVKYEFWPNILKELENRNIKTLLVSGIFRENQPFFKWYGKWIVSSLQSFDHFFVQNDTSKELLRRLGFTNVTISGDTRFDRVYQVTNQKIDLEKIARFKGDTTVLVAGSTWPKDEELLVKFINDLPSRKQKYIIAPHNIHAESIVKLKNSINKNTLLYSEIDSAEPTNFEVLIIDSIGLLSKIYYYADIAFVGGGFGTGLHNILEPATFSVPIIIGPDYEKFNEAKDLVSLKACLVIRNIEELNTTLSALFINKKERTEKGELSRKYILENIGATEIIFNHLRLIL